MRKLILAAALLLAAPAYADEEPFSAKLARNTQATIPFCQQITTQVIQFCNSKEEGIRCLHYDSLLYYFCTALQQDVRDTLVFREERGVR